MEEQTAREGEDGPGVEGGGSLGGGGKQRKDGSLIGGEGPEQSADGERMERMDTR